MTDVDQRKLTAIHEAGHAIVGQALGFTVHEVTVRDGPGGGACEADREAHDTLDAIQRDLSFTLAGRLAVALERQEDLERFCSAEIGGGLYNTIELEKGSLDGLRGTGMSYRDYVAAVGELLDDDLAGYSWMDKTLPAAAKEAVRILSERWNDVQALAIRLEVRGEVDLGEKARQARVRKEIARVEASLAKGRPKVGTGR